ncbi:hypothetical protein [Micromonospora wenchangensis]|uniref:hypothetical protein n=1 Tax=Micromonospora wenchangensis TaxID=1185415 RepID=UPI003D7076AF
MAHDEDTSSSEPKPLRDYMREIESHPGRISERKWRSLQMMCRLFEANLAELKSLFKWASATENTLELVQNVQPSSVREEFWFHLIRLSHNYLAAVSSLIDHTRNLLKDYADSPLEVEYNTRKGALIASGCAAFLKNLRNYMMHYNVPPFSFRWTVNNTAEGQISKTDILIDRLTLNDWSGWSAGARLFIASKEGDLILEEVVDEYALLIRGIYSWLLDQYHRVHAVEIDEVNDLIAEMNSIYRLDSIPEVSLGNPATHTTSD